MKLSNKKIINLIGIIAWMCFIFYMSNQSADVSNAHSGFVVDVFNYLGINLDGIFGKFAMTVVRKGAHITEYLILFILVYNFFKGFIFERKLYMVALIIVVGYACTDEIHQLFIEGRAGRITDVMIDSIGPIVSITFIEIKNIIRRKRSF